VPEETVEDSRRIQIALRGIRNALEQLSSLAISIRQSSTSTNAARVFVFQQKIQDHDHYRKYSTLSMSAVETLYPDAAENLRDRLHESMLNRYARLRYWDAHDRKLNVDGRTSTVTTGTRSHLSPVDEASSKPTRTLEIRGTSRQGAGAQGHDIVLSGTRPSTATRKLYKSPYPKPPATSARFVRAVFPLPPYLAPGEEAGPCRYCRRLYSRESYCDTKWWE
jgi:hypothetical protein